MASEIDTLIAAAKAQAEASKELTPSGGGDNLPSTASASRGSPLGLDDLMGSGGITVDHWLKINEFGIFVAPSKTPLTSITAAIDLAAVRYKYSVRYGNNPVKYDHTYDHRVSMTGKSWSQALEDAKKVTNDAREYRSADIPLVNIDEIKAGKDTLAEPFSTLGLTLNVTGWRKWETFVGGLARKEINAQNDIVLVDLGWEERNKNGNTWGLPTFTLREKLDEMPS